MFKSFRMCVAAAAALVLSSSPALAADQGPAKGAAPAPAAKTDLGAPVARVNGVEISQGEYERNWKFFLERSGIPESHGEAGGEAKEYRAQVLDRLIDEELLFQEAKTRKLLAGTDLVEAELTKARGQFPTPEAFTQALVETQLNEEGLRALFTRNLSIQGLVEGEIAKGVSVSDADVHTFYAGNQEAFEIPEQVRARHILLEFGEKDGAPEREEKRRKIEELLQQAKAGADFAELARKNSQCPSAAEGGDLGFFGRGQMAEPFEAATFALKPGEISGVVETEFGLHVIKLEERKPAGVVPEQDVAGQIREFLTSQKTEEAVEERLKALRAAAKIERLLKL